MTKYEYLYFPDMPQERDCSGLCGDRVESLFPKHKKVVKDLLRIDPKAVEKLVRLVAERGMDAVKVRVEVEASEGVGLGLPRLTGDFEKLLSGALLELIDNRGPLGRSAEGNCAVLAEPVKPVGNQRPAPGRSLDKPMARRRSAKGSAGLTRDVERCDPSPTMARTQQGRSNRESAGSPRDALDVEVRIPEVMDCEFVRLRHRLKGVSAVLAQLDPKQDKHIELLEATTELTLVFSDFVDQWLRARIVPIEESFNEKLKSGKSDTLHEKQDLSKWANAELRTHGLAIRCPKTRRPSILLADPGHHPTVGRFQLQHKAMNGKWKRSFSTPNLPALNLMPDLSSLDVDLAHVLSRLEGAGALAAVGA